MSPLGACRVPRVASPRRTLRDAGACPRLAPPALPGLSLSPLSLRPPPVPPEVPGVCRHKALPSAPGFRYNPHSSYATPLQSGAGLFSSTRFTRRAWLPGRGPLLHGARRIKAYSLGPTMLSLAKAKQWLLAHLAESAWAAGTLALPIAWSFLEGYIATHVPTVPQRWALRSMVAVLSLAMLNVATFFYFRPKFKFDPPTGTWVNLKSDLRYCAKCKSQKIVSPLRNQERGWQCPACYDYFPNPARKEPEAPRQPLGEKGWMAL
jgi:hypothetical protein